MLGGRTTYLRREQQHADRDRPARSHDGIHPRCGRQPPDRHRPAGERDAGHLRDLHPLGPPRPGAWRSPLHPPEHRHRPSREHDHQHLRRQRPPSDPHRGERGGVAFRVRRAGEHDAVAGPRRERGLVHLHPLGRDGELDGRRGHDHGDDRRRGRQPPVRPAHPHHGRRPGAGDLVVRLRRQRQAPQCRWPRRGGYHRGDAARQYRRDNPQRRSVFEYTDAGLPDGVARTVRRFVWSTTPAAARRR
jgi:hypothetical protein